MVEETNLVFLFESDILCSHSREIATSPRGGGAPRNDDLIDMQNVYVVHYHEIALKGRNRPMFLRQLQENICRTAGLKRSEVRIVSGRLIVIPDRDPRFHGDVSRQSLDSRVRGNDSIIEGALSRTFGISSFSPAVLTRAEYGEIERAVLNIAPSPDLASARSPSPLGRGEDEGKSWQTFAIAATRGDKKFSLTSKEIEIKLGDFVRKEFGKKVDLEAPDVIFYTEVFPSGAVVYTEKIPGPGGLPVGTQPKVAVLLSGGIDSPVAAYRIMKRGTPLIAIHFHSYPFTSRASIDKVKELIPILEQYHGGRPIPLYIVPLADAQKQVVQKCNERYRVLLYRRLMWRIAEAIARRERAQALVSGESLGQVASQTIENMTAVENPLSMPIFRPLIGYDKQEIIEEAKQIGTYDISIQPHDDCCSLFMPKRIATKARIEDLDREESKIDAQELIDLCLHSTSLQHQ